MLITLQKLLLNGKIGDPGPNAALPVAPVLGLELGHAVNLFLEAVNTVLEVLQSLGSAR